MRVNYFIGAFALVLGLSSCTNDESGLSEQAPGAVRFTSSIEGAVATRIDAWTGSESVGIYMVGENNFTAVDGVSNKEFTASSDGLSPVGGTPICYPADGSKVKFAAYYPYTAEIGADNIYKVDLSAAGDNDLLYATTDAFDNTNATAVSLKFRHQLASLVLNVTKGNAAATGVTAKIIRETKADFNLSTGVLSTPTASAGLAMTEKGSDVNALIMPGTLTGSKIVFTLEGTTYTWNIGGVNLEAGKQYTYAITLNAAGTTDVEANLSSEIIGWAPVAGANQGVDADEIPTTPEVNYTASFSGDLTQETAIGSDAKISVNYTNGDGADKNVTVDMTGAKDGIVVVSKTVTLVQGTGSFDLAVTGNPTASGEVNFSIKIGDKEIATTTATVVAKSEGGEITPVYTSNVTGFQSLATNGNPGGGKVSINGVEYPVLKLGTKSGVGIWTSDVIGANKTKLSFYAAGWTNKTAELKITINGGATIDGETNKTESLVVNGGLSSESPYEIEVTQDTEFFSYDLSGVTAETTITFETTTGPRALVWGINVE